MKEHFGPLTPKFGIDVVLLMIGLGAIVFNGILLRILLREKLAIDRGLMILIGGFDVVLSLFVLCTVMLRWSGVLIRNNFSMCLLSSVVFNSATVLTPVFAAQLTLVRYLAIVRRVHMGKQWVLVSIGSLLLVWAMFLWRGLTSELILLPSGVYCTPLYWGEDFRDKVFGASILLLVVPSVIFIPLGYYRVIYHYKTSFSFEGLEGVLAKRQLNRNAVQIALVMVAYVAAFLPELLHVVLTISFDIQRTAFSDGLVMALLFSITIINALFTLLLHEETQRVFTDLISNSFMRLKSFHLPV